MKDPLSSGISSYDILEVPSSASNTEIQNAFIKALGVRKFSDQQIANARKRLLEAASRLEEDFFLYSKEKEHEPNFEHLDGGRSKPVSEKIFELIGHYDKIDSEFLEEEINE